MGSSFSSSLWQMRTLAFPRATRGRGEQWQLRKLERHVSSLWPRRNPFKSTAKDSRDTTTHSEESYLKWGFQAHPWAHCLVPACLGVGKPGGAEWPHRVQKTSSEPQGLDVCASTMAMRLFRDLPLCSFQHPFRVSVVLLYAGSLWVVALDVPVLQNGSNGSTASVKSFLLLFVRKSREVFFSCFAFFWKALYRVE